MGLYDRDYIREDAQRPTSWLSGVDVTWLLIGANVAVFILNMVTDGRLIDLICLPADAPRRPQAWWKLLTYGFMHDPKDIRHILFNMFSLWLFGRDVEGRYSRGEFLRLYLTMIVVAGLAWCGLALARGQEATVVVGASGAVSGVALLFAIHFPDRELLLLGVLPIKARTLAIVTIALDVFGASHSTDRIAHAAHLGGAAFAGLYYYFGWNFGRISWPAGAGRWFRLQKRKLTGPTLRAHAPPPDPDLGRRADELLAKITREGIESLTPAEKRTLEEHSRQVQDRRRR